MVICRVWKLLNHINIPELYHGKFILIIAHDGRPCCDHNQYDPCDLYFQHSSPIVTETADGRFQMKEEFTEDTSFEVMTEMQIALGQ